MSTALTTTAPGWSAALAPQNTDEAWKVATALAKSDLVPKAFKGQPSEILIAAAMGSRLGLDVFSALQSIAVVNGKPTLYGDALLAVCQAHADWRGSDVKWEGKGDEEVVTVTIRRNNARGNLVESTDGRFGVADAKRAGLWTKQGPWSQFPRRMMEMRARAYALRGAFADALLGFHSREEVEDAPVLADVTASATVREEPAKGRRARVLTPEQAKQDAEAPAADAKPPETAAEQAPETKAEPETMQAGAQVFTVAVVEALAKTKDGEDVDRILQSYDLPSIAAATQQTVLAALHLEIGKLPSLPADPDAAAAVKPPTLEQVREAVNRAASALGAGGATRAVKALQDALGYPIGKAGDIREEHRAKAIGIVDALAGIGA